MYLLSRSEEIVLLSVWKLRENAYGVTIRDKLLETSGYKWSLGAIYAPLHRLEKKGYVKTSIGEPIPERGGRSRIYYQITRDGKKALQETKRVHDLTWADVPGFELDKS